MIFGARKQARWVTANTAPGKTFSVAVGLVRLVHSATLTFGRMLPAVTQMNLKSMSENRLQQLRAAVAQDLLSPLPIQPCRPIATALADFVATTEAKAIIAPLRRALAEFEGGLLRRAELPDAQMRLRKKFDNEISPRLQLLIVSSKLFVIQHGGDSVIEAVLDAARRDLDFTVELNLRGELPTAETCLQTIFAVEHL